MHGAGPPDRLRRRRGRWPRRRITDGVNVRQVALELVAGRSAEEVDAGPRPGRSARRSWPSWASPTAEEIEALLDPHGQTVRGTGVGGSGGRLTDRPTASGQGSTDGAIETRRRRDDRDRRPDRGAAGPPSRRPAWSIEYRERGVPWMLIPPLLVLSAVAAVVVYHQLAPRPVDPGRPPLVAIAAPRPSREPPTRPRPAGPTTPRRRPAPTPAPEPAEPAAGRRSRSPPIPARGPEPGRRPPAVEPAPAARARRRSPGSRASASTPKASRPIAEADRDDPAVAPAARRRPRDRPGPRGRAAVDPSAETSPRRSTPTSCPPDPREAQRPPSSSGSSRPRRKAEADRGQFHAELRAICRKSGDEGRPGDRRALRAVRHGARPADQEAGDRGSSSGPADAGSTAPVRINLLRSLGFPEPVILDDIFDEFGPIEDGISPRTGPGPRTRPDVPRRPCSCSAIPPPAAPPRRADPARLGPPRPARPISRPGRRPPPPLHAPRPHHASSPDRPGRSPAPALARRSPRRPAAADLPGQRRPRARSCWPRGTSWPTRRRRPRRSSATSRPSSSSCPASASSRSRHEVKRDVTAREDLKAVLLKEIDEEMTPAEFRPTSWA